MTRELEAGRRLHLARGTFEEAARHLGQPAAALALDVVVVLPASLIAGEPVPDIQALDHALGLEHADSPEDSRIIARPGGVAYLLEELVERPGAVLGAGEDLAQGVSDRARPGHSGKNTCKRVVHVTCAIAMLTVGMRGSARLLLLAVVWTAACSSGPSTGSGLKVVSTVTQVSALAGAVGGDRIQLTALLTPRDDPHGYELKPDQVTRLSGAAVILLSGAGADKWMEKGLTAAGVRSKAVDLSTVVRLRSSAAEGQDPHWWYDVDNAKAAVVRIAAAFSMADPADRASFESNAAGLAARLEDADRSVRAAMEPIPEGRRLFVANHDAFNYFLQRYAITLVGDIIPSTDSIAAVRPADIALLVRRIRERGVCAVFTETTIDPKLAQQIAAESHVKVYDGKLYGDAIGEAGTAGATLEGAIRENGRLLAAGFRSC